MTRLVISTVGTSLKINAKKAGLDLSNETALQDLLNTDPYKASAEANALLRLIESEDELVFLHSDTPDGAACSAALVAYFLNRGHVVQNERLPGLTNQQAGFTRHGLRNFVQRLAYHIRDGRRRSLEVGINNTGGFKIQIAYGNVVGLIFGVPVYYIHENFTDLLTLPVSPVAWDYSLFAWHREFFDWIDSEARSTFDVQQRLSALPEQIGLLIEEADDGNSYLSPLGETYLEAFRGEQDNRKPLFLSQTAIATLKQASLDNQGRYHDLIERLRRRKQGEKYTSTEMLQEGIYKYPKGKSVQRVFFTERDGKMYILEFSGHSEERRYQDLMQNIRWSHYEHGEFTELS